MNKAIGLLKISTFLFVWLYGGWVFAQTVPSSCESAEDVEAQYYEDAYRLAMRKVLNQNLDDMDSIEITPAHVDTVLNAILAVYNAVELPARDTVVEMFDIHTFPYPSVVSFLVAVYPSHPWVQNLSNGIIPTGNDEVDALIDLYGLELMNYIDFSGAFSYHLAVFEPAQPLNLYALATAFEAIPGVNYSGPNAYGGDGNDITDTIFSDHVSLSFSHGWGDCMAGCMARRYWHFKVYFDCSVEYVGSSGSEIIFLSTSETASGRMRAFPNPFTDKLHLEGLDGHVAYTIFDLKGAQLKSGFTENGTIFGLENLAPGLYLLQVLEAHTTQSIRIVKDGN
jgi:hypothetical protein